MSANYSELAPQIWEKIKTAQHILLHLHPQPDGDSIGSALALYNLLLSQGKKVTVVSGDSPLPLQFSRLPGFDYIRPQSFVDLNWDEFDLFLILDSSAEDQISKKIKLHFPLPIPTIIIDHHASNRKFADLNLVDATAPANCQVLYRLFQFWPVEISPAVALCLLTGIYTDTGGFKYRGVTSETFRIAAELAALNDQFPQVFFDLENQKEPPRIAFMALALNSLEHYFQSRLVMAAVPLHKIQEQQIPIRYVFKNQIANLLKSVRGWEIGVEFIQVAPEEVKVSLRTRDPQKYDLSRLGAALGGGGHASSAGALLRYNFSEAKKFFLRTVTQVFPELQEEGAENF